MPLLQFDITARVDAETKTAFAETVSEQYVEEMATAAGHVAVTIRERAPEEMHLGREVEGPLCFLDADVRRGRPFERKRAFALSVMEAAHEQFGIPEPNLKVVFTEHPGEEMMGVDRVGSEWEE